MQKLRLHQRPPELNLRLKLSLFKHPLSSQDNPIFPTSRAEGVIAIYGSEILVQRRTASGEIWLQRETIPIDVIRQALET